ncbi:hypothetical protein ASE74_20785 [Pedobacter sp. Leaf216]|uniref:DUF7674 family protein n=1 Tax=Pedobacter sp. Leaf216 TaxID=1735684 RepID=UPI0006F4D8AA|nr:hypothetical protein [Pedobacter sp. Leaf216]KQM75258.1 hypothetical protein ASE74_20785 [Pedobacter sp. Leaf216]
MNNKEFIKILINAFPEIKEDVLDEDNDGLITLQIGYFKRFAQKAIDENNSGKIKKCFKFIDDTIGKVDSRLENAIYLSFLRKLDFDKNPNAKKILSKKMLLAKNDLDRYDTSSGTNDKLNKFLNDL